MTEATDELESFRKQWREEVARRDAVQAKASKVAATSRSVATTASKSGKTRAAPPSTTSSSRPIPSTQDDIEYEPRTFHDLEDKEEYLKLANESTRGKLHKPEPQSALEHYEKAVEEEVAGKLGSSVASYRKAFKLDHRVHHVYKEKHFPAASAAPKPSSAHPANAIETGPGIPDASTAADQPSKAPMTIVNLVDSFASLSVSAASAETNLSRPRPCPIAEIPAEVLVAIFKFSIQADVAMAGRLTSVCKRFAYVVMTENSIWKPIALGKRFGMKAMHYRYSCDLRGFPLTLPDPTASMLSNLAQSQAPKALDMTPAVYPTYRSQFRHRPRIRFNGCYISTVNYQRQGASAQSQYTWATPVHIVTYYRYLRFFRDGTVISLLTTSEPSDVVHHMSKENIHDRHASGLPTYVMKDALHGRWRLTGPASSIAEEESLDVANPDSDKGPGEYAKEPQTDWSILGDHVESEGNLNIETEGVVPKYMWKMQFALGSAGRKDGSRNNKLSWKGFWSYNRLTDDWGEFALKNDRPFYFSRVKSYGLGLDK